LGMPASCWHDFFGSQTGFANNNPARLCVLGDPGVKIPTPFGDCQPSRTYLSFLSDVATGTSPTWVGV
jgi:hypothetical protein